RPAPLVDMPGSSAGFIQSPCSRHTMRMRVSARLHASAAPDAPAPMISTSATVSAITLPLARLPIAVRRPTANGGTLAFGGRIVENAAARMLSFLSDLSLTWLGVTVVASGIALALGGLLVARRILPHERLSPHHAMTGPEFQVVGKIYAVLLAFVVITVWQHHNGITDTVEDEASNLLELGRDAQQYPEAVARPLLDALRAYAEAVVDDEWDAMRRGGESPRAHEADPAPWGLSRAPPLRGLPALGPPAPTPRAEDHPPAPPAARPATGAPAGRRPPAVLWVTRLAGAVLTVGFSSFFGVSNLRLHLLATATFPGTIALFSFVIVVPETPFTRAGAVSPEPFQRVLRLMQDVGP